MSDSSAYMDRLKIAAKARVPEAEADEDEDYRAVSFGRVGVRPQLSITFRKLNGHGVNLAYSHYYGTFDEHPNVKFTVEFTRHTVSIEGRNLERAYRLICDHKAREILECDPVQSLVLPEGDPVVTRMEIREKTRAEE